MIKFPRQVVVGGVAWKVRLDSSIEEAGYTERDNHLIVINSDMPQEAQEVTLIHEVLHVCIALSGTRKRKFSEEEFIELVQYPLYAFIKRHSNLFRRR